MENNEAIQSEAAPLNLEPSTLSCDSVEPKQSFEKAEEDSTERTESENPEENGEVGEEPVENAATVAVNSNEHDKEVEAPESVANNDEEEEVPASEAEDSPESQSPVTVPEKDDAKTSEVTEACSEENSVNVAEVKSANGEVNEEAEGEANGNAEEPMHLSPTGDVGCMDVEETSQGALEETRKAIIEEMDVNMDKDEAKAMEEDVSQDGSASMNTDEHSRDRVVNAAEEETRMNFQSDGGDEMDQDMQFVHVSSNKDKDSMSVSQSGEESMEVSVIQDEDPFGGTNDVEKQPDGDEAMDVEDETPDEEKKDVEDSEKKDVEDNEKKDAEVSKKKDTEDSEKKDDEETTPPTDTETPAAQTETPSEEKVLDEGTRSAEEAPAEKSDTESATAATTSEETAVTQEADKEKEKTTEEEPSADKDAPAKDATSEKTSEETPPEATASKESTTETADKPVDVEAASTVMNMIRNELDEEICIIPDSVPRVMCNQDGGEVVSPGKSRRKSKSIEDISDRMWEKTVAAEALKDGEIQKASPRPQRQAAKKAETQIKELAEEESNSNESGDISLKPNEVVEVEASLQMCLQCYRVQMCKFQLYQNGKARYLCAEECYTAYQKELTAKAEKAKASGGSSDLRRTFVRKCAECQATVSGDENNLSWETMDYCNEICLGKYQAQLGSHCANCKGPVQQICLGKYCVRFGYDVKQFCCSTCLEEFKKGLKVCSYCQKDIAGGTEGFLAPVGDKGQFKDFCTQACMEKYDQMSNNQPPPTVVHQCAVCNNEKVVKVEVLHNNVVNKLCSEPCFAAFKFVNAVVADQCDMCKKYYDKSKMENFTVFYGDSPHSFCCKTCMNVYILANRKIVPCYSCKVKKYNFDMIKQVTSSGQLFMMCSLHCLSLYKVSMNAVSPKRVKCDMCQVMNQAQYHLAMSDATIRNFCSYQCVMQFQGQFSKNAPLTVQGMDSNTPIPTGGPTRTVVRRSSASTQNENQTNAAKSSNLPVIASVQSLAGQSPPNNSTTPTIRPAALKMNNSNILPKGALQQVVYKQQTIFRAPPPKVMRNKSVSCRPYTNTKGVSCRPHPCSKETQTDEADGKPILIPVPVPIYVPAPLHMYSNAFPVPIPFPLPVPVPIFIPTTRNSINGIMKEIKRIQEKIPTDPFEAELLMMAEMVAGEKKPEESDSESDDGANDAGDVSEVAGASSAAEGGFSPEAVDTSNTFGEDMLQMALKMASELDEPAVDLEAELTPSTITPQTQASMEQNDGCSLSASATESEDDPEPVPENRVSVRRKRSARSSRGGTPSKRGRRQSSSTEAPLMPPPEAAQIATEKPDANMCLKFTFGVNAWKQWVMTKNAELEKAASNNRKLKLFKPEILQLTADELNYSLCLFVKEVRKPNGSEYAPDTIYYLCLGIQQYLFENGRIDNIFTDSYYEKFTECLDEVAKKFQVLYNDSQYIVTRVEEEHLWECTQLGAHSPHVLLSTLMFFNTKHFNLVTVEEHMQLSFSHIMKHWKRNPNQPGAPKTPGSSRNVLLRFYPPQSAIENNSKKKKVYEQQENEDNPLRCPVKLYEFYLSKCPESVKTRNDVFYLLPERSCVPDSPVWYSTQALGREPLMKMLNRVKMVKEINVALLAS